ncbi:MAG: hypothetical protein WCP33_06760 [Deltaproteobacteria bacterium]
MLDPIVEEVRNARMEHTMKFNGNLASICADLRTVQDNSGHSVVSFVPRTSDNGAEAEFIPARVRIAV